DNIGLLTCRQQRTSYFRHVFLSKFISERCSVSLQTGEVSYIFPLYIYPEIKKQISMNEKTERRPNLDMEIVNKIAKNLKLKFTDEKEETENTFAPIDLLDYIYAVLHS